MYQAASSLLTSVLSAIKSVTLRSERPNVNAGPASV